HLVKLIERCNDMHFRSPGICETNIHAAGHQRANQRLSTIHLCLPFEDLPREATFARTASTLNPVLLLRQAIRHALRSQESQETKDRASPVEVLPGISPVHQYLTLSRSKGPSIENLSCRGYLLQIARKHCT